MKRRIFLFFCLTLMCMCLLQPCALAEEIDAAFDSGVMQLTPKDLGPLNGETVWLSSSADGQTLLGLSGERLVLGSVQTGAITEVIYDAAGSVEDTYGNCSVFLSKMLRSVAGSDDFATWSPDGRYIAVKSWSVALQRARFEIDLFLIDTQTSSLRHLKTWPSKMGSGDIAVVYQVAFSADSRLLYYSLYGNSGANSRASYSYDLATGETAYAANNSILDARNGGVTYTDRPDLCVTAGGQLLQMSYPMGAGEISLIVTQPDSRRTVVPLSSIGVAPHFYMPSRLYYSAGSGYAVILWTNNMGSQAVSLFRPDEGTDGADRLLMINPANPAEISSVPVGELYSANQELTETGSQYIELLPGQNAYHFRNSAALNILKAAMSPDGEYLLLMTGLVPSDAAFYALRLSTLEITPVEINGLDIAGEAMTLTGSATQYKSGILWCGENLLLLSSSQGTGAYEFALTEEPTPLPTEEPTPVPTEEPTPVPTEEPTPVPTEEPTPVPTEEPTPVPTEEPTPVPAEEPASVPAEEPASVPAEEPDPFSAFLGSWHVLEANGEGLTHLHILKDGGVIAEYEHASALFAERLAWSANGPAAIYVHTMDSLSGDAWMMQAIDENTLYMADFGICERVEKDPICAQITGRWECLADSAICYYVFRPDMTAVSGGVIMNMADINEEMIYTIDGSEIRLWPVGQSDNIRYLTYDAQTDSIQFDSHSFKRAAENAGLQAETSPCVGAWKATYQLEDSSPITSTVYLLEDHSAYIVHDSSYNAIFSEWTQNGSVITIGEESASGDDKLVFTLIDGRLLTLGVLDVYHQPIYFDRADPAPSEYPGVYHTLYCSGQTTENRLIYTYLKVYLSDTGLGIADPIDPEDDDHDPELILWDTDNSMLRLYEPGRPEDAIMIMPVDGVLYAMTAISEDGAPVVFEPVPDNDDMIGTWNLARSGYSMLLTLNADGTGSMVESDEIIDFNWKADGGLITLWSPDMGFEEYAFFIGGQVVSVDGGEVMYCTRAE